MQIEQFLRECTGKLGPSGHEMQVAEYIAGVFEPLCDDVHITPLHSVIAHIKGDGPKVMFEAHLDEIGLIVTKIEDDGSLRMGSIGGVDPRILPAMRVRVHTKEGEKVGVVGAKAPHLLSPKERDKNYQRDELYVDLGLPADKVKSIVSVGSLIQFETRFVELQNRRFISKTVDDRGCVAILLRAMQLLQNMKHRADLYFVAAAQEEVGGYGARTSTFEIQPDFAVALDVCHAMTPDANPLRVHELTSLVASMGPYINPMLRGKLMEVAKEQNIEVQTAVVPRGTSTDTDSINIIAGGVPSILLELPLKYMHTSVELFDMRVLEEGGRLLANFAAQIAPEWEEALWN